MSPTPVSAEAQTGHDARSRVLRARLALWRVRKNVQQRLRPRPVDLTVFVAGMQRSGTNLVMDVLDASAATDVFHETDPRAFERYEMRDAATIHALVANSRAPVFVIKALCELDRVRELMDGYAPAKTLWVVRDWRDSVRSAVKSFGNFVPQWRRLASGDASDWRGRGMTDATRELLAALWHDAATEAEGAAVMWFYRNALFFERGLDSDARVRVLFYERLVSLPEREIAAVYAFLGLRGFGPAVVRRIHARSVKRREIEGVSPAVAALCDDLLARFAGVAGR